VQAYEGDKNAFAENIAFYFFSALPFINICGYIVDRGKTAKELERTFPQVILSQISINHITIGEIKC
jgi:hypothetical protein